MNTEFENTRADDYKDNNNPETSGEKSADNEVEELRNAIVDQRNQIIRSHADMENQRKRLEREIDKARNFAIQDFIVKFLPAKDSMEKGIDIANTQDRIDVETLLEGMVSTLSICNEVFKSAGLEEIDPSDTEFNPELHEAVAVRRVEGKKPNIVLSVFQKGYLLNGRLIRPARVEVSIA